MSIARSYTPIIAGLAALLLGSCRDKPPDPPSVLRLSLAVSDELVVGGGPDYEFGLALAPDGRRLVFPATTLGADVAGSEVAGSEVVGSEVAGSEVAGSEVVGSEVAGAEVGKPTLYLRDLSSNDTQRLPGTVDGVLPFWSPDGTAIGFFASGKLRVLDLASGSIRDLADAPSPRGGTWFATGDIVFAPAADGALVRRGPDGTTTPLTSLAAGETSHRLPQAFGAAHVIFYVRATQTVRQGVWIVPLDRSAPSTRLTSASAGAIVTGDAIAYSSGGALVAQRVGLEAPSLAGTPVLLATSVGRGSEDQLFAASGGDVLIYGAPSTGLRELRWLGPSDAANETVGEPMHAWAVRVAPAASRVAVTRLDPQLRTLDIWTYDAARPMPRRISPSINLDESPAWSPDGSRLAWVSGRTSLTVRDSHAASPETVLRKFERPVRVTDWRDEWFVLAETQTDGRDDIIVMRATPSGEPRDYVRSPFTETLGAISPDERWLAYASDESGRFEIYADTFPTPRARARLTVGGGTEPRWSRDGTRIFFRRGREVHVVRIGVTGTTLDAVSSTRVLDAGAEIRSFDVARTEDRFIVNVPAADAERTPMSVLVNVTSLLRSPSIHPQ